MGSVKRYWKWDDQLNDTPLKLGQYLTSELIQENNLTRIRDGEYKANDGALESVYTENDKIKILFYKNLPFSQMQYSREVNVFMEEVSKRLEVADENYERDILIVLFRAGYAARFIIKRNKW